MTKQAKQAQQKSQERSEAARLMGRTKSKRKAASSRRNGRKGGRRFKPLEEIDCTCRYLPKDDSGHIRTCLKRRALERRIKAGMIEPIAFKK